MLRSWISVNSADSYKTCAEQGCGIIQVPRFHVERQLRAGTLVEILAHTPCPPMVYSVLYPHHRPVTAGACVHRLGDPAQRRVFRPAVLCH